MPQTVPSRFPALTAPEKRLPRPLQGFGLALGVVPLPIGEIAVLLAAWLLVLHI